MNSVDSKLSMKNISKSGYLSRLAAIWQDKVIKAIKVQTRSPAVSVVIPFYGRMDEVKTAIGALECQTINNFEVILVADGCLFDEKVLRKLRDLCINTKVIRISRNGGAFAARIKGAAKAHGEYLWFFDHDDYVEPNFIQQMLSKATVTLADVVECPFVNIKRGEKARVFKRFEGETNLNGENILKAYLLGKSHNNLANKLIRRSSWRKAIRALRSMGISLKQRLIFCEDMLCTIALYDQANQYASTLQTEYTYQHRPASTTTTSRHEIIEACLSDLATVLSVIKPILLKHSCTQALDNFKEREVNWAVANLAVERLNNCLTSNAWDDVGRIQANLREYGTFSNMKDQVQNPLQPRAAAAILNSLTGCNPKKVMLICAHPDDECVGAGLLMSALQGITVAHVTNGVPEDPRYAKWAGFDNPEAYKHARLEEARAAIDYAGLKQSSLLNLGFVDQQISYQLPALTESIAALIDEYEPNIVITHPYEGGHPDHDAVAFACHHAQILRERSGKSQPHLVEMTSYFSSDGKRVVGEFAQKDPKSMTIVLNQSCKIYKDILYRCYSSQLSLLKGTSKNKLFPSFCRHEKKPPMAAGSRTLYLRVSFYLRYRTLL
ncbi:PIG-L family deacetylase, partial [Cyanobium sp. ATX 6A2]|uniref:PIG-L family deacetylase n=1 Tax=Cyanobium sp. ATX 6A2 TaxID=2823700 RepID=UPI0020CBEFA7